MSIATEVRNGSPTRWKLRILDNGGTIRRIYHEDRKERRALAVVVKRHEQRIERINKLCKLDGSSRFANFRVFISTPSDYVEEKVSRPWRGGQRWCHTLDDDRVQSIGSVNSLLGGDDFNSDADEVLAHLRKTVAEIRQMIANIEADVKAHPEAWEPLPTLAEVLEG